MGLCCPGALGHCCLYTLFAQPPPQGPAPGRRAPLSAGPDRRLVRGAAGGQADPRAPLPADHRSPLHFCEPGLHLLWLCRWHCTPLQPLQLTLPQHPAPATCPGHGRSQHHRSQVSCRAWPSPELVLCAHFLASASRTLAECMNIPEMTGSTFVSKCPCKVVAVTFILSLRLLGHSQQCSGFILTLNLAITVFAGV